MRISLTGAALAVVFALGACSSSDSPSSEETTPKELPQGTSDLASTPPPADLSEGGVCADGQGATINVDNAQPTITGDCGTITIEGMGVVADIEEADNVIIRGENGTFTGRSWDVISVEASSVTIDVDEIDEITMSSGDATITAREIDNVTLDGDNNAVTADEIDRVTLNGDSNIVTVSGAIDHVLAYGNRNTVEWTGGATEPEVDEGHGNTFDR